jgi:1-deoxy-D-xylulose-5-phosphate synthase
MESMLERAVMRLTGPVAVRYPRGGEGRYTGDCGSDAATLLRQGTDLTMVSYGAEIGETLDAADLLAQRGVQAEVIKLNQLTPLDPAAVLQSVRKTGTLLTAEDSAQSGSVGQRLAAALEQAGVAAKCCLLNCGDTFIHHGAVRLLKQELSLDGEGIAQKAMEVLGRG